MTNIDMTGPRDIVEGLMKDTCTIYDVDGISEAVFNRTTGTWTQNAPTSVYAGKCMARDQSDLVGSESDQQGETEAGLHRWVVKVPFSVVVAHRGQLVVINTSDDPGIVGKRLMISSVSGGTYRASRRLTCVDWVEGQMQDPAQT